MKLVHHIQTMLEEINQDLERFQNRLDELGYEGVTVANVEYDEDGSVAIDFEGEDDDVLSVLFTYDEEEGAEAIIMSDSDDEDDEYTMIDLDALSPKIVDGRIDMQDISWLNDSAFDLIFGADDEFETGEEEEEEVDEKHAYVVRDGKKVKVGMARRKKKKRLTSTQRQGIRKAVRSRKKTKVASSRKRKKSLKIRKRMGLKKTKNRGKFLLRK